MSVCMVKVYLRGLRPGRLVWEVRLQRTWCRSPSLCDTPQSMILGSEYPSVYVRSSTAYAASKSGYAQADQYLSRPWLGDRELHDFSLQAGWARVYHSIVDILAILLLCHFDVVI